jgi:plastocyanin
MRMKDRSLLALGLALIVMSLIGSLIGAVLGGTGFGWRGPAPMRNHMGWMWGGVEDTQSQPVIPGADEVIVRARDFSFSPSTVTVDVGTPVNITLVNEGNVVHDLAIPELDLQVVAGPGGRASTGLTPERSNEYRFECTVPGHAQAGMVGHLLIANG